MRRYNIGNLILLGIALLILYACNDNTFNDPYPHADENSNIYHTSFDQPPQTLDPARSYAANEYLFLAQIYEPPLQYHYLKRPYTLVPLTAVDLPKISYFSEDGSELNETTPSEQVAYSVYTIEIKPGIYYQPHPAFAQDEQGHYIYHNLTAEQLREHISTLRDFKHIGTRELTAQDYVYQIKRLSAPQVQSPIYGFMSTYIEGLAEYSDVLRQAYMKAQQTHQSPFLDLRIYPLAGVRVIDRYHYQITIIGKYPQFAYWLAMPFFGPMPWEADKFYSQPGMAERNITLDWEPIGTGAYMMAENNPNYQIVLARNPNFHSETYPNEGEQKDAREGLLANAGERLPFIDMAVFSLEKESIPRWNKFLQGYYDRSAITSDNFDQAINIEPSGQVQVSRQMENRNINLQASTEPAIFYLGFNMLDERVGGDSERARLLRQAISIAIDHEEFISIFLNGRGLIAFGPIPPGIFGYTTGRSGINPYVYDWKNNQPVRKSLAQAKLLMEKAGYPGGRDINTGRPLVLNFDIAATGGPDERSMFDWLRKQFAKLGIQLNIRATQYNRFQEKLRNADAQIFSFGWSADYPDPENFLFLFYGPNSIFESGGQNAGNYLNSDYDQLFEVINNMPDTPERLAMINKMVRILQYDSPVVWGYYPKTFVLSHGWMSPTKPGQFVLNNLKYAQLKPAARESYQRKWNQPILWPIYLIITLFILAFLWLSFRFWQKQHH